MSKRHTISKIRQKSCLTAGVIALAAVIAMAGSYYKNSVQEKEEQEQVAQVPEQVPEPDTAPEVSNEEEAMETMAQDTVSSRSENSMDDAETEEVAAEEILETTEEVSAVPEDVLSFSEDSTLGWPVQGNILMEYSMDKTIYFATLDQYKYNPAMIIDSDVNTKVVAAADEKVVDVSSNETTGLTLTADLGNGYQAVYGQLKEVSWETGDTISRGEVIGYVAEPTKYFCVEGSNLYFAVTKDGTPVNPLDFLE